MSIAGSMPIVDRFVALIREKLAAELAVVDTAANAQAGSLAEASFTSPTVPSECIQYVDDDTQARPVRIVVTLAEPPRVGDTDVQYANEGLSTGSPRMRGRHVIRVRVIVTKVDGSWGDDGALRRCDRIATAIRVILMGFPKLSIPSLGVAPMQGLSVKLTSDKHWAGRNEDDPELQEFVSARELLYEVLRTEARAA